MVQALDASPRELYRKPSGVRRHRARASCQRFRRTGCRLRVDRSPGCPGDAIAGACLSATDQFRRGCAVLVPSRSTGLLLYADRYRCSSCSANLAVTTRLHCRVFRHRHRRGYRCDEHRPALFFRSVTRTEQEQHRARKTSSYPVEDAYRSFARSLDGRKASTTSAAGHRSRPQVTDLQCRRASLIRTSVSFSCDVL